MFLCPTSLANNALEDRVPLDSRTIFVIDHSQVGHSRVSEEQ